MIVRTTLRPDDPIEVDAAEYTDLSRQRLLLPDPEPAPAAAAQPPSAPAVQPEPDPQEKPA